MLRTINDIFKSLSKRSRLYIIAAILLGIGNALGESLTILSIVPIIDIFLVDKINIDISVINRFLPFIEISDNNFKFFITIFFITIITITTLTRLASLWVNQRTAAVLTIEKSLQVYKYKIHQKYSKIKEENSSILLTSLTSYMTSYVTYINLFMEIIVSLLVCLAIASALFIIDEKLTILIFGFSGSIYTIIVFVIKPKLVRNSLGIAKLSNDVIQHVQDSYSIIREIILRNLYKEYTEKLFAIIKNLRFKYAESYFLSQSPRYFIEGVYLIGFIIFLFISSNTSSKFLQSIETLTAFAFGLQKLLPKVQLIISSLSVIKVEEKSVRILLRESKEKYLQNKSTKQEFKILNNLPSLNLEFHNLGYKFDNSSKYLFKDFSYKFKAGDRVGIVGESGAGKTILLEIISTLICPTNGTYFINNEDIHSKFNLPQLASYSRHFAFVPQHFYLFNGSLENNITLESKKENINYGLLEKVLMQSNLLSFVSDLSLGLETIVQENGDNLSGGQKQRIMIARALYMQPKVLILDEPTSALDGLTESKIMDSIYRLPKEIIIFMSSHNKNTLNQCNILINVKKDGSIEIL